MNQSSTIEQLISQNAKLVSSLESEKQNFTKIEFDILASQTLFSSLKELLESIKNSVEQGIYTNSSIENI